ncbi:MAG: flippase [Chloroflexi bacterium]|nr:flippase [Chloroflexota bacterium]
MAPRSSLPTRLGKNSLWLLGSRLGTQVLVALFTIVLARRLGSAGFGEYAFIAALIFIANTISTFGTDMLLMREIAARSDLASIPAALLIQLALSALFVFLLLSGARYFPNLDPSAAQALKIYGLALFPLALYSIFTSALRGKEQMDMYALLGLAGALMQVGLAWLMPALNLPGLALGMVIIQVLLTILAGIFCATQIADFWKGWHFNARAMPGVLRSSAPIGLLAVLGMIYQKLSTGMLSASVGPALTGGFAAALRVLEASKSLHMAVFTALYPAMAKTQTKAADAQFFLQLWSGLLAGAALVALGISILAEPLVNLLFGADFSASIPALRILAWMLVPYTINTFLSLALLSSKQEKNMMIALTSSLVALVALNLWLIPRLGLSGAAWAALSAESLQAGLLLLQLKKIHWFQVLPIKRADAHELPELS